MSGSSRFACWRLGSFCAIEKGQQTTPKLNFWLQVAVTPCVVTEPWFGGVEGDFLTKATTVDTTTANTAVVLPKTTKMTATTTQVTKLEDQGCGTTECNDGSSNFAVDAASSATIATARTTNVVRALINPANPSLVGTKRAYFPRGGPLPPPPPPQLEVSSRGWGGFEAGENLLYPAQVVDGLVHMHGGSELVSALLRAPVLHTTVTRSCCDDIQSSSVSTTSNVRSGGGGGDGGSGGGSSGGCGSDSSTGSSGYSVLTESDSKEEDPLRCHVGSAVVTPAFGTLAKHFDAIVHTPTPFWPAAAAATHAQNIVDSRTKNAKKDDSSSSGQQHNSGNRQHREAATPGTLNFATTAETSSSSSSSSSTATSTTTPDIATESDEYAIWLATLTSCYTNSAVALHLQKQDEQQVVLQQRYPSARQQRPLIAMAAPILGAGAAGAQLDEAAVAAASGAVLLATQFQSVLSLANVSQNVVHSSANKHLHPPAKKSAAAASVGTNINSPNDMLLRLVVQSKHDFDVVVRTISEFLETRSRSKSVEIETQQQHS